MRRPRAFLATSFGASWLLGLLACGGGGGHGGNAGTNGAAGANASGAAGTNAGATGGAAGTTAGTNGAAGTSASAGTLGSGAAGASAGTIGSGGTSAPDGAATDAAHDGGASADAIPAAGCGAPGAICWDFEEAKLPTGWTPYRNEFMGTLLVDDTKAHRGTYALHAKDLQGNTEGKDGGPKKTMRYNLPATFGPVLWGRAFIYVTPARPKSHAGFFNARYPRPGAAAAMSTTITTLDWYEVASSEMNYVSIYHPPEPPGTPEWVQVSTTPLALDRWACVEWLFDAKNGAAAEAAEPRVWLDGVEIPWSMSFVSPTTATRPTHEKATTFSVLEAGVYLYQGLSTPTNWWIDDLGVSPQRLGCD